MTIALCDASVAGQRFRRLAFAIGLSGVLFAACGGDDSSPTSGLDPFLPPLPTPDGTAQTVYAGEIASPDQLLPGAARSGLVGDFFMRNARASFTIQRAARFIGVVPWGGNVVDAVLLGSDGRPLTDDHFGELSLIYVLGRTCAHDRVDVLLDGSGGGPAVIRARGLAKVNDFINLKGLGFLSVPLDQDPTTDDKVECATTYTLYPDQDTLEVAWTLYNGGTVEVAGPYGSVSDTGGEVEAFTPGEGFARAGFETLLSSGDPHPVPYTIYQGPGVSYGILPIHDDVATPNSALSVAGVSIVIFGAETFLDILQPERFYLRLPPKDGVTHAVRFIVGKDGAAIEAAYQTRQGATLGTLSGHVSWTPGDAPAAGARVGVFRDANGDGTLDGDDPVVTYFDVAADGSYTGQVAVGDYLVRGDVRQTARTAAQTVSVPAAGATLDLALATPARYDYTVVDAATGAPIPCKLTVIGATPVDPDQRIQEAGDRTGPTVKIAHAVHGTSVALADGDLTDPVLELPPGGPYKIFATRGPEWSIAQVVVAPTAGATDTLTFELERVVDTTGYLATEFHQHAVGSPDSAVSYDKRLASLVGEGIEFFSSTDHDYLSDYAPLIDAAGLRGIVDSVVGVEATPFVYGHFQAYPLDVTADDPSNGAVDWATGGPFALLPGELWQAYRDRGAKVIQVNHPRSPGGFSGFQAYFDVAGLVFDYAARTFSGRVDEQPVPADWLRLPEAARIFSDAFDALEVWNGSNADVNDTNADGWREFADVDLVMRDYMDFLTFGKVVAPVGNSDSHTKDSNQAGFPRTMVKVSDDSAAGLEGGLADEVWAMLGTGATARDVIVTGGPMLRVTVGGQPAVGRVVAAQAGAFEVEIEASAAEWVDIDTIEVFINTTFPERGGSNTTLPTTVCFTTRTGLSERDTCGNAALGGARPLTVTLEDLPRGAKRRVARASFTLVTGEIPHPAGATSQDAWLIARVSGQRAMFPLLTQGISGGAVATLVSGTPEEVDAVLRSQGIPAMAFGAATLLDVDGGGWRAPLTP